MKELDKQQAEETHNKLREIISSYEGNEEYGDCIIDEICFLFGHATTTDIEDEEQQEIPITYATIQRRIGWSRFAEETNRNVYAINEFGDYDANHLFYITEEQAKKLNL